MQTKNLLCAVLPALALLGSCNKGAAPTYNDRPVVTAYLAAGSPPLVTISRQAGTSSGVAAAADDLNALRLELREGANSYLMTALDSGRYTAPGLLLEAGRTYTLTFDYNGKTVTASTVIPEKPQHFAASDTGISVPKIDSTFVPGPGSGLTMPDPVELSWTNSDNSYYLVVTENLEASKELIRDTLAAGGGRPAFSFRNEPSISAGARINAGQFAYFGRHRIVLYKLQPDYAALYESVSNASTSLSTAASKVTNGFGIFTGINADTLYLQVNRQ